MGRRGQIQALVIGWAVLLAFGAQPGAAYYHFVHYTNNGLVQDKFDLRVLPNKTVPFYVSDAGLSDTIFSGNDTFNSALTQIRQATAAWNAVDTSELRVAFGGLESLNTPQTTPGVDIVFEDMPPGVLAFTGHSTSTSGLTVGPNGPFVPITRSLMHLSRDFTKHPGPSYSELFYTTVVHEMGHALGLQHTFTGAAMSTFVTRTTSRAKPVDRDDIAGISLLYPKGNFVSQFGSITGRVTSGGQGVHLASVVALRPTGAAVSTLTNPDGTYRIDGLQQGVYWVYVHPIPPDANITFPVDANGNSVPASGPTETVFWAGQGNAGTRDLSQFGTISIGGAGQVVNSIDFSVQSRPAVSIYDVSTYSFFGQSPVSPAYLSLAGSTGTVVAQGVGITSGSSAAAGLGVQLLGGFATPTFTAYGSPTALAIYLSAPVFAGIGPRHLLLTLPNDAYVVPGGVNLTLKPPPFVGSASPNPDGTVTLLGTNIQSDSRIFFDGQPATITIPASGGDASSSVTVQPPPGASGQTATIMVYNSDGQNSMFLQPQSPLTYSYPTTGSPSLVFVPTSLPAGASAMVDVAATGNLRFVDGQTSLGFGSSDLSVQRVWVLSPTHLVADVSVAAGAAITGSEASVLSGSQLVVQPFAFQTQAANPQLPIIALPPVNANPAQSTLYAGAVASLFGSNLAISQSSANLTINGLPAQLLFASATQINFVVPTALGVGPAILNLSNGAQSAFPVVIQIDTAPPSIVGVSSSSNTALDALRPALLGDTLQMMVSGLDAGVLSSPSRVHVNVNGTDVPVTLLLPVPGQTNVWNVQFSLPQSTSGAFAQVFVSLDGNPSNPVLIALRSS